MRGQSNENGSEVVTNIHTRKPREGKNGDAADDGILPEAIEG
jgi:hypothetical protein